MNFTVIIPTLYNPTTLKIAIESIYNQTLEPEEILIVDSSENKKSEDVVSKLISEFDGKINYLNFVGNPNQTRNYACEGAKNELIAFLDDDDTWEKNYLELSLQKFKQHQIDFLFTSMNLINKNGDNIKFIDLPDEINLKDLFVYNHGFFCSNLIIKKEVFLNMGGFDSKSGSADKDLAIRLVDKNYNYKINSLKIVNKRDSEKQWTKNYLSMIKNNYLFFKRYKNQVDLSKKIHFFKKIIILFLKYLKSKFFKIYNYFFC